MGTWQLDITAVSSHNVYRLRVCYVCSSDTSVYSVVANAKSYSKGKGCAGQGSSGMALRPTTFTRGTWRQ